jgi:hypothetical protein
MIENAGKSGDSRPKSVEKTKNDDASDYSSAG